MGHKKIKEETNTPPELVLASLEGEKWMTFPVSVVDAMRQLILRLGRRDTIPKKISIVAALRQEGVTYISRALATTMAHDLEATICIVDLNWWWPSSNPDLNALSKGLAAILTGGARKQLAPLPTSLPNLWILPAGELPLMDRFAYAYGAKLAEVIEKLNAKYDYLILDVPAVLAVNEAVSLASLGTSACIVTRQGTTPLEDIRSALDRINHLAIAGVILNQAKYATPPTLAKVMSQI